MQELPTPELESLKAPLAPYVIATLRQLDKAQPLAEPQTPSKIWCKTSRQ